MQAEVSGHIHIAIVSICNYGGTVTKNGYFPVRPTFCFIQSPHPNHSSDPSLRQDNHGIFRHSCAQVYLHNLHLFNPKLKTYLFYKINRGPISTLDSLFQDCLHGQMTRTGRFQFTDFFCLIFCNSCFNVTCTRATCSRPTLRWPPVSL